MYRIGSKKNREDVIALRWPKACLSCGIDMPNESHPRYAIVGMFHEVKQTQVLVKMPGFFYMCGDCSIKIETSFENATKKSLGCEKLAHNLHHSPWNEFIELGKTGSAKLPQGVFREKLQQANPDAVLKTKTCPMDEIRRRISKEMGDTD